MSPGIGVGGKRHEASPASRFIASRKGGDEHGFSVLEVLVAFVIVALVVTALFRLFGGALGNAAAADEWTRALLVAQSRLELAASAVPLRETNDAGSDDDGRLRWRTSVAAYVPPDAKPDIESASEAMTTRLYRVSVDVTFGDAGRERTVSLTTVKLGERATR
jgi:general secretion pathway protein I